MTNPIRPLLAAALLSACGSSPPDNGPDPAAAAEIAARLCTVSAKAGHECTHDGVSATVLAKTLSVSGQIEKRASVPGSVIVDFAYAVSIDGASVPALGSRIVGSGRDLDGARQKAASDWASIYGAAIIDRLVHSGRLTALQALQDDQAPPRAFEIEGWVAYPGWMQLHGQRKNKRQVVSIDAVLAALAPIVREWDTASGATHAVLVDFEHRAGYDPAPACTLDGAPSARVCELALTYDWPEPGPSYVLRQYFVFTPGPLPGAEPKPAEPKGTEPGGSGAP